MGKKSKVSLKTQIVLFAWLLLYFLPPHLPSPPKICRAGFCNTLPFTWQKRCFCGLIPPSLPTACVPLPQGFLCGAHWGMQVLGQVCLLGMVLSCQMSYAWPSVLSAKMAAWFKTIYPTSKSSQREHEMNLHVCFLLYFTLCSWLLFCYSLVWHLSMPAALVLQSQKIKSPITAVDVMPFIPAMFFGQELIGITFPQVCAWWLWAGVLCCSWRVPAPTVCFLPVSPSHPAGEQIPVLWNARVKWVLAWKAVVLGLTGTMGSGVSLCGIACDTLNSMFLWFLDFVSTSSAVLI